ncbi:uncharacterized protein LOC100374423 [Saccoglossus kowalevskii]|uniref:Nuclear speckle splicing regulatory protein 1-like n=1 Tax=Saccoglossus kowalevskii TaxID=10224 RepID=A0ABM0GRX4_SACKO|nr:PREDICTED: nuclear speckle splicing regulatory protein 1-like [Saccoglossus kowalevskii]
MATYGHGKQYGLIKKTAKPVLAQKLSIFQDDSSDEETASSQINMSLKKVAIKNQIKKQTQVEMQKALEEDPTVYEYDSIYDEMERKKKEESLLLKGKSDKKPKYINSLLKAATIRKKEQDRRMERKIQKEREDEGDEFDNKEEFVTSAYRKKLEERAEEEFKEKRQAELEAKLDVTKQKDLSGFYRHLLNQTVGEEKVGDSEEKPEVTQSTMVSSREVEDKVGSEKELHQGSKVHKHKDSHRHRDRHRDERQRRKDGDREKHKERHKDRNRDRERSRHRNRDEKNHRQKDSDDDSDNIIDRKESKNEDRDKEIDLNESNINDSIDDQVRKTDNEVDNIEHQDSDEESTPDVEEGNEIQEEKIQSTETRNELDQQWTLHSDEQNESEREKITKSEMNPAKFAKRNMEQTVSSARERYLARKATKLASRVSVVEPEED